MINLCLLVVFFVCVAALWNEGMWSNAIMLINVLIAAMVATNYFEPLAATLDEAAPSYTYLWDFLALWGLFAVTLALLRAVTDLLSKHRVRFRMPVEHVGRVVFACCVGWLMVGFTAMSIHVAPLPAAPLGGSFQKEVPQPSSSAPDRQWLAFMQSRSLGAMCRSDSGKDRPGYHPHPDDRDYDLRVFDPRSDFIMKYRARRENFEREPEFRVIRDQ